MRLGALEVVAVALAVGTGGGLALEGGAEGNELVVNRAVVVVVVIGDGPHADLGHAKEAELWRTAVGREEEAGLLQSLAQVAPSVTSAGTQLSVSLRVGGEPLGFMA